jgi:dTDP-4-dehydrorhamnose 3,5-epimerase
MEVEFFDIKGLALIKPTVFEDHRGYFIETFNKSKFNSLYGPTDEFVQDNESSSSYGTLRGIHFQKPPYAQSKLVRVIKGEVLDLAIDLRAASPSFGKWKSFLLTEKNKHQVYVPKGFGHAFVVLSETAIFSYKVDNYYHPESDSGIIWNDKSLHIDWQINDSDLLLSEKDKNLRSFEEYANDPDFQ